MNTLLPEKQGVIADIIFLHLLFCQSCLYRINTKRSFQVVSAIHLICRFLFNNGVKHAFPYRS